MDSAKSSKHIMAPDGEHIGEQYVYQEISDPISFHQITLIQLNVQEMHDLAKLKLQIVAEIYSTEIGYRTHWVQVCLVLFMTSKSYTALITRSLLASSHSYVQ